VSAVGRVLEAVHRWSDTPVAIQLSHAGRKASTEVPWKGGAHIPPDHPHDAVRAAFPSERPVDNDIGVLSFILSGAATTEDYHAIDLAWLRRKGCLKNGYAGRITWSRGGAEPTSIGYRVEQAGLWLIYAPGRVAVTGRT
jgi:hypothetical protein